MRCSLRRKPSKRWALDEAQLADANLLGGYRNAVGWGRGRTPGASRDQSFRLLPLLEPRVDPLKQQNAG